jgi:hypothetical protein
MWWEFELEPFGVDGSGSPTSSMWLGDQEVIVHHTEIPEGDITMVDGIRCTTALRTVIDLAAEVSRDETERMLDDCLGRGLFTVGEAWERLVRPDLAAHPGAERLVRILSSRPM